MGHFYVENFGCRATQADGAAIERQLAEHGLAPAATAGEAELVVLNTCTVTAAADQDARAAVRRIHRANPSARILVTGCYAQRAAADLAALEGVSLVIGNSHKHRLAELAAGQGLIPSALRESRSGEAGGCPTVAADAATKAGNEIVPPTSALHPLAVGESVEQKSPLPILAFGGERTPAPILVDDIFAHTQLLAAPVFDSDHEKTRPNLKVQDGCNNRCSFCVIPYVRGRSRSLTLDEVVRNVEQLVANGYQELVVSGINLGRWGRDLTTTSDRNGRGRFANLLRDILDRTSVPLLRISSVEPMDWSDELIALIASSPRIAPHAHVPLQSASDRILRLMHRRYRPWHYEDRIRRIRAAMPLAAIGADVMVGFPDETAADFEETRSFIERLPFTYLHVFTYSARPGTPAAAMPSQVPIPVARERNRILRELAAQKKRSFQQQFLGGTLRAITLTHRDQQFPGGRTEALTANYQKLWLSGSLPANRVLTARIHSIEGEALVGQVESS